MLRACVVGWCRKPRVVQQNKERGVVWCVVRGVVPAVWCGGGRVGEGREVALSIQKVF